MGIRRSNEIKGEACCYYHDFHTSLSNVIILVMVHRCKVVLCLGLLITSLTTRSSWFTAHLRSSAPRRSAWHPSPWRTCRHAQQKASTTTPHHSCPSRPSFLLSASSYLGLCLLSPWFAFYHEVHSLHGLQLHRALGDPEIRASLAWMMRGTQTRPHHQISQSLPLYPASGCSDSRSCLQ